MPNKIYTVRVNESWVRDYQYRASSPEEAEEKAVSELYKWRSQGAGWEELESFEVTDVTE